MTFDDRSIESQGPHDRPPRTTDAVDTSTASDDDTPTRVDARPRAQKVSVIREIVETLLLALIIFVAVRAVVLNFRVDGLSMTPNLENSEMLLVNRNAYLSFDSWALVDWLPGVEHEEANVVEPFGQPERGDIVVFDAPVANASQPYIKRVIGLEGETVVIRNDGVYIDGQELNEPYLEGAATFCSGGRDCPAVEVPEDHVFVLGDNRDNSQDSRAFGPVPVDEIIGKAWLSYWPVDEVGTVPHYEYPEISDTP